MTATVRDLNVRFTYADATALRGPELMGELARTRAHLTRDIYRDRKAGYSVDGKMEALRQVEAAIAGTVA